jgi:hypothetical protein
MIMWAAVIFGDVVYKDRPQFLCGYKFYPFLSFTVPILMSGAPFPKNLSFFPGEVITDIYRPEIII